MHKRARPTREPPRLLVLIGLPGSGKTTFAQRVFASLGPEQSARVSQDVEGSVELVRARVTRAFQSGARLVMVDRTNITRAQRRQWTMLAKQLADSLGVAVRWVHNVIRWS